MTLVEKLVLDIMAYKVNWTMEELHQRMKLPYDLSRLIYDRELYAAVANLRKEEIRLCNTNPDLYTRK